MQGFAWTKAMSVGVPALDADHRCLVRIINLLDEVEPSDAARVVETVIETLAVYCRYHFAREEHVMTACGFPELPFHQDEHEAFSRTVEKLRKRRQAVDPATLAEETSDYLRGWLLHHILIQDMAYKPFTAGLCGIEDILPQNAARNLPAREGLRPA